jgi:PPP family 3-phenylpropionic acid transporter
VADAAAGEPAHPSGPQAPAPRISGLRRYGALSFAYFAAIGLFNPYAPLWFQSLGFSTVLIGGIASLQNWTRVVAPYAWSWAGDHSGRRSELIRLAAAGALLSALGLMGVQAAVPVALVTALLFLANSGVVPLYEAQLAQVLQTPNGTDTARYGRVRMWGSVGFIVSVTGFGLLLEAAGIGVFPIFVAAMNGLLLLAAWRLPASRADATHSEPPPPVLPLLRQPAVAWFFASIAFTVLAHTSLYVFFSLYLVSLGYGKSAVGLLWAVSVGVEIAFFWFQGRWIHRLGPYTWLQWVGVVTALRFVATAAGGAVVWVLVLAQAAHAVTFAAHHASCIALVNRYFPGRLRGRGQALYTTLGYGIPGVLGGLAGGALVDALGYAAVFWAAAVCGVLAFACARRAQQHDAASADTSRDAGTGLVR